MFNIEINGKTRDKPAPVVTLQASQNLAKTIQLNWEPIPGAAQYEIYISSTLEGTYKPLARVNQTHYMHKVDEDSVVYFYKVSAIDPNDVASDLPKGAAQGATLPPPATPQITKGMIQGEYALIEWDIINDERVKAYAVYRYEGRLKNPLRFANTIQTQFIDKEMQKGKRYIYKVVSVDSEGNESLPSRSVELLLQ